MGSVVSQIYEREFHGPFPHADPAGIAFIAHIFTYAHSTYEAFVQDIGISWQDWFQKNPFLVPIRHVSSDFHAPFRAGEVYKVKAYVGSLSDASFKMSYHFTQGDLTCAQVDMVHTFVSKETHKKAAIPAHVRKLLQAYLKVTP